MAEEPHKFSKVAEELIGEFRALPAAPPRRSRLRPTQPLADVVEQLLQKHRIGRSAPEDTLREHWREIVGPANAAYSHPARIERNLLTVLAAHAVVRNELFLHREAILARIRKFPGCGDIKGVNIRAG